MRRFRELKAVNMDKCRLRYTLAELLSTMPPRLTQLNVSMSLEDLQAGEELVIPPRAPGGFDRLIRIRLIDEETGELVTDDEAIKEARKTCRDLVKVLGQCGIYFAWVNSQSHQSIQWCTTGPMRTNSEGKIENSVPHLELV